MQRALVAGVVLALGVSTAGADQKAPPREADLGQKRSVAPDAALGGTLEAARPATKEAGPALAFEAFRKTIEVQVSDKRREEIASLRKLIDLGGGSAAEMPQWYFRLAELLWEESQYFFFEANRRDDQLIALGKGNPREAERLKAEKTDLEGQSRKLQDQAIALYKAIIAKYPKYPRLDEVLYFLAENLSQRDRFDPDALKAYRALIERYPNSRYVADAWMAFGEYYFEKANKLDRTGNLKRALEAYKKAAEYQESSVYAYALYKQGWVHYNLGEYEQSLELFRAVIYFGELPTSTVPADKKLALVKEARKDYVRTYSHVGSAEGAAEEFRRVGGEKGWWDMLRSLADLYYGDGKDRDAILVYARLIREKPLSPEAPFYQSRVVTSAGRMGRKEAAVQQAHVFVKMLRDIEASPAAKDESGKKVLADARRDAEQTLRVLAVTYHNEWKKTRDEPVAGFAAAVYRDYLDVFPNEPTAYEMRFFHAELRYALADFEGAGAEYEAVALRDVKAVDATPPGKPGKFFKDALENAVFAWDLVAKKLDETREARPDGSEEAHPPRPRAPEAPRGLRSLPQVPAEGREVGRDRLQGGEHPLPPQRVRRGDRSLHAHRARPPVARARRLLDEPRPRRLQPARRLAQRERLGEAVLRERRAHEGPPGAQGRPRPGDRAERVQDHPGAGDRARLRGRRRGVHRLLARLAPVAPRADRALQRVRRLRPRAPARSGDGGARAVPAALPRQRARAEVALRQRRGVRGDRRLRKGRRALRALLPRVEAHARRAAGAGEGEGRRRPRSRAPRVRGEEGERRHHQRGGVPRRPAGVGARGGGERGLPRDVAEGPRRAAHVPLPRRPVRPPRPALEGAEAARRVPAPVREGSGRVARDHPAHGRDLREGRQRAARARHVRRGAPLLQAEPEPGEGPRPRRSPRRRCTSTSSPTSSSTTASR